MVRGRGAKRIWATQDGALWRVNQFANSDIPYVRADVADGYRAALEYALPLVEKWCHYQGDAQAFHDETLKPIREALAKGDEG